MEQPGMGLPDGIGGVLGGMISSPKGIAMQE